MNCTRDLLIKKAYAQPRLRQNILNKGMICLYCDYAGFAAQNNYGIACCLVHNRTINVTAKKLLIEQDGGSNYGELQAILYSLEILAQALTEHQPKLAIIFTDCNSITKILSSPSLSHPYYEHARHEILASIHHLKKRFPEVDVSVKYISNHKKNNALHRLAHNAARDAAGN